MERRRLVHKKGSVERRRLAMDIVSKMAPLFDRFDAARVYLFGSVAREDNGPEADIDLAVEGVAPASFFKLYGELIMLSPIPVDLVDLDDCQDTLLARVKREGRLVHDRNTGGGERSRAQKRRTRGATNSEHCTTSREVGNLKVTHDLR